jgi:hypothetical protein
MKESLNVNHKALAIRYWNKYLKMFNNFLTKNDLWEDLSQEIELIAIESEHYKSLVDIGKCQARLFRAFLKSLGFHKLDGRWCNPQNGYDSNWWISVFEANAPPGEKQFIYNIYNYFNGKRRYRKKG